MKNASKRQIKVFTAGCGICQNVVAMAQTAACASCEVQVLNVHEADHLAAAQRYGVTTLPSVVVDEKLLDCCRCGLTAEALKKAGVGVAA